MTFTREVIDEAAMCREDKYDMGYKMEDKMGYKLGYIWRKNIEYEMDYITRWSIGP